MATIILKQFQNNIYTSIEDTTSNHLVKSALISGETLYGGEMDYLWLRIFTRLNAGAVLPQKQKTQNRRKKKIQANTFPAHTNILRASELVRKINFCLLQTKDPKYIKRVEVPVSGLYRIKTKRCEKYFETKRLARYWRRYLEDIRLNYLIMTSTDDVMDYLLDFYKLKLFNVDEDE